MSGPRLLETHPCQGGATAGYMRAGWHVTAVDSAAKHAKYNPAPTFIVGDAARYIREHGHEYDAIHASPPCQWYTRGNAERRGQATRWERTIPDIREALLSTGKPYVIENVRDAGWDMVDPVLLCGCMFDLSVRDYTCRAVTHEDRIAHITSGACDRTNGVTVHLERGRLFETNWGLTAPRRCEGEGRPRNNHPSHEWVAGAYGGARRDKYEARHIRKGGYVPADKALVKQLLGIEHDMTWEGLYECLPPVYTEHVGRQLIAHISGEVAA